MSETPQQKSFNPFDHSVPMPQERIDFFMQCLERGEDRGDWSYVEWHLRGEMFRWMRKFADADLSQQIDKWEEKLADARAYEAVHGKGSLYKTGHPINVDLERRIRERDEELRQAGRSYYWMKT